MRKTVSRHSPTKKKGGSRKKKVEIEVMHDLTDVEGGGGESDGDAVVFMGERRK